VPDLTAFMREGIKRKLLRFLRRKQVLE